MSLAHSLTAGRRRACALRGSGGSRSRMDNARESGGGSRDRPPRLPATLAWSAGRPRMPGHGGGARSPRSERRRLTERRGSDRAHTAPTPLAVWNSCSADPRQPPGPRCRAPVGRETALALPPLSDIEQRFAQRARRNGDGHAAPSILRVASRRLLGDVESVLAPRRRRRPGHPFARDSGLLHSRRKEGCASPATRAGSRGGPLRAPCGLARSTRIASRYRSRPAKLSKSR